MRTTLDLPDQTFRALKAEAALRGFKLKELVTQLIETGLNASRPVPAPSRSPLPVVRPATGVLHPAISNAGIEKILASEDV
jgi:hypothetical protein